MGRGTWWATDHWFAESVSTHKIMIKSVNLLIFFKCTYSSVSAAAAANSLQSCLTLCNPIDGSPPGSPLPWDSPGGVGCHFFLQCMKVKSEREVTQLSPTPTDPMDYIAYQAPPSMGFSREEYWSGVPLPSPGLQNRPRENQLGN